MANERCIKIIGYQTGWLGIPIKDGCVCILNANHKGNCECPHTEKPLASNPYGLTYTVDDGTTFQNNEGGLYG